VVAFAVYSDATTKNYRQLRTDEISKTVAFESESVEKIIAEMERNAIDLALAGLHFYMFGEQSDDFGKSVVVENFSVFPAAVGGGIWFEPYSIISDVSRLCFYAFFDEEIGAVRYDPEFRSEEYDYHTQIWYTQILSQLDGKYSTAWTEPYFDDVGTNSLMTTVGSGIYDTYGRFIGMSTVDWRIQDMIDRLSDIKITENSFVLVASPRDDYIISNTQAQGLAYVGESLGTLPWYGELHFAKDYSVMIGSFTAEGVDYIAFSRVLGNGWLFSIQIPAQEIFSDVETRNNQFTFIIVIMTLILLAVTIVLVSMLVNRPLKKLILSVEELGSGNLDKQIEVRSEDEIGKLAKSFNKMTVDLKKSIEQSAREHAEKERIGTELDIARQIQESMLPCIFPPFPDRPEFEIFATMMPAKEVGGDFYDFYLVDDDRLAVVIADVSGKGVPAALFMVITKILIKSNAQQGKSPEEVFRTVNNLLCENNETGMFVTAFMGLLDIPSGKFTYANAGHNPPLFRRAAGKYEYLKTRTGFVLGGLEGFNYTQEELIFKPDDGVYLYTDGVTEAMDCEGNLFSSKKLEDTINYHKDTDQMGMLRSIKQEIDKHADGADQADDITMLTLTYKRKT